MASPVPFRRGRRLAHSLLGALAFVAFMPASASAIDWDERWWVGVRSGVYLDADEQSGGFRTGGGTFGQRGDQPVNFEDGPFFGLTLGRGLKQFRGAKRIQNCELTLEVEVSRWTTDLGNETAFTDLNASTRVELPQYIGDGRPPLRRDGDEEEIRLRVGEVTMTPVLVNVLLHWGSGSADFYAGLGAGMVFAEATQGGEYSDFVGDPDGNDLTVDDALALNVKLGSNVRLSRAGRWYLYFEGQFFATQVLASQQQAAWPGVEGFFGSQDVDTNNDGVDDAVRSADFRLIDPGQVRLDGALVSVGLRYRFGGDARTANDEP